MIKEIKLYVDKVNELNIKAVDSMMEGTFNERDYEDTNKELRNEFHRLYTKYGEDRLLKEMGLA